MSEYAKNIQTIEDLWKKRIELPKLAEVVRCIDCKHYDWPMMCERTGDDMVGPDGFCAWGERKRLTCKCGEELESEGKCPSCGRWVHD